MATTADDGEWVSRNSAEWDRAREQALKRDQYRCQACTAHPGKTSGVDLQVHHIHPIDDGGTHRLDNLLTLCNSCHWTVHRYEDEYDELDLSVLEQHESTSLSLVDYRKDVDELRGAGREVCELLIENGPMQLKDIAEKSGYSRSYVQQQLESLRFARFACRVRRGVYAYIPTREYRELQVRDADETGRKEVAVWDPGEQVGLYEFVAPRDTEGER